MSGVLRLSLDFECGWGYVSDGSWRAKETSGVYRNLRAALKRFTRRADELEMSFCWAVVGAMIQNPKDRSFEHLPGKYASKIAGFLEDSEETTHDGRDLLDLVSSMRTNQMFGTHTYSHMAVSDSEQSSQTFGTDLQKAIQVMKKRLSPVSQQRRKSLRKI